MGTLKVEMFDSVCFINSHDGRMEIFAYIDSYYHIHRKHYVLDHQTPAEFEAAILTQNQLRVQHTKSTTSVVSESQSASRIAG